VEDVNRWMPVGLAALAALVGGCVAAAARKTGLLAGAATGLAGAIAFTGIQYFQGIQPTIWDSGVPAGAMFFVGGLGGWCGAKRWPSVEVIPLPVSRTGKPKRDRFVEPVSVFRAVAGGALAAGCTVWAGWLRDHLIASGSGLFGIGSHAQGQFIAWVIAGLAILFSAMYSGAGTQAGAKNGFLTSLVACVTVFVIHIQVVHEPLPAERFFITLVGLPDPEVLSRPRTALFLATNTLPLGIMGGWLGAMLFPKTVAERKGPLDRAAT
jgi:hypothetical protein